MRAFLFALAFLATAATAQPSLGQLAGRPTARPATLADGFYLEPVATGLQVPVDAAMAPDGRLFVAEKDGRLVVVDDGTRTVLLDLTSEVLEHHDRGLLGVALAPDVAVSGHVYLLYTVSVDGVERSRTDAFARLTRVTLGPDGRVVAGSRRVLLGETFATGIPACYFSHSPATLAWGRDGTLLVGTGDAASYNGTDTGGVYGDCFGPGRLPVSEDVGAFRSQQVTSLAGKILRIDPATGLGLPSNPFYTGNPADNASRVWALGFRNPFRFSIDPASGSLDPAAGDPGRLLVGDVGYVTWEDLTVVRRGDNAGWPCREGPAVQSAYAATSRGQAVCPGITEAAPAFAWHHQDAGRSIPPGRTGASVIGGAVYRGARYPAAYHGRAFYGDYVAGWIATAAVGPDGALSDDQVFAGAGGPIVSMPYDPTTQSLLLVDVAAGTVSRLRHTGGAANNAPVAQAGASVTQGGAPLPVAFSGAASFDPDGDALAFQWAFGDGAASSLPDPVHTYAVPGVYTVRLTVTDGFGASGEATVAVTVRAGAPPTAAIVAPAEGAAVAPGQTITLAGAGTDPDGGPLTFAWDIALVHNTHDHPDAFSATGASVLYAVPFHGDAGDVFALRLVLTTTDVDGLTARDERLVPVLTTSEVDVTAQGTPAAYITAPIGGGSRTLEVLRDGVEPAPTTSTNDYGLGYDTFTGDPTRTEDWLGYTFAQTRTFRRLRFVEGVQYYDGGWFETLGVQVRQGGTWRDVEALTATPSYAGADGRHFDAYRLAFAPVAGDGIRIVGRPGGQNRFVSAAELRVFAQPDATGALPAGWASADLGPVGAAGGALFADSAFAVSGGGDLWGDLDGVHLVYRPLVGDGAIVARLTSIAAANPWAKAGLMIRASPDPQAPHATMLGTPGQGVHLQYRPTFGAETEWQLGAGQTLPTWLRLVRTGSRFAGSVSSDGVSWTPVGAATVAMPDSVLVGMAVTSSDFTGRNDLATARFETVAVTGAGAPPPVPAWASQDVGPVNISGGFSLVHGVATVQGSGDLWGDTDGFHFVHQPLDGDGVVTARLEAVTGANVWAKAGLMLRAGLGASDPYVSLTGTPGRGVHLQSRAASGAETDWARGDDSGVAPLWLRLQRTGNAVTGFLSADGQAWEAVGTVAVPLPASARAGLAVTSTDYTGRGDLATGVFSSVAIGGAGNLIAAPLRADAQAPPPAFAIASIAPNPTAGRVAVHVGIARAGTYHMEVLDVLGRRVTAVSLREDGPGLRTLSVDLSAHAPGVYAVRVTEPGGVSIVQRLTRVR